MKKMNEYEKRMDSMLNESLKKTSLNEVNKTSKAKNDAKFDKVIKKIRSTGGTKSRTFTESEDEDTLMLMIGGEKGKHWPWYFKKMGDSTHFFMANNEKALSTGAAMAHHVGQHKGEHYYEPLRKWLRGGIKTSQLNGKKFG